MNLKINNLQVLAGKNEILKGINLEVGSGKVHVIMGPNGSGKSTLAQVIAGSPFYTIVDGRLSIDGKDIKKLSPDKRAKLGIFLGFQNPVEIPGVSVFNVLRKATLATGPVIPSPSTVTLNGVKSLKVNGAKNLKVSQSKILNRVQNDKKTNGELRMANGVSAFRQELLEYASSLKLSSDHLGRSFNEGFSGGEKKRNEILQMLVLSPKLVILDEIDSGLDVDGLKLVARAIKQFTVHSSQSSVILITHYARILKCIKADFVHVMMDGKIVRSGKAKLASEIENKGYESIQNSKVKGQNYGSSRQARTI